MLYVAQIEVPHRAVWGNVHSLELLLPSKIRNVRGYLVNAVLGSATKLKRCYSTRFIMDNGQITTTTTYIVRRQEDGSLFSTVDASQVFIDPAAAEPVVIDGLELLTSYQEPATHSRLDEKQPISSQIGVVSLSLNNTQIIADSTPLCVTQHLNKQGIVPNTITLPKPERVQGGSFLRIIIEEQQLCPFLTEAEWEQISTDQKESYFGDGTTKPENSYTAKIYLSYD